MFGSHSTLLSLFAASLAITSACLLEEEPDLADSEAEIIGGTVAGGSDVAAIGAVRVEGGGANGRPGICTGILIAPKLVLTSESCVQNRTPDKITFLIGKETSNPSQRARVRAIVIENSVGGGATGRGIDAALLHLRDAIDDVAPLPLVALSGNQVGRRFRGFGYGVDEDGDKFVRRGGDMTLLGTRGKVLELVFASFEDFLDDGARRLFPNVNPAVAADRATLKRFYDGITLLDGVDAWFGGRDGDANMCDGDMGGPITTKVGGKLKVVGMGSWGLPGCAVGAGYTLITPKVLDFVARERD